jgi:type VI secretion system secreted protein Hcp
MAFDTYLHIDGIKGESTDSAHKDWIELISYSPATPQPAPTTAAAAGGGSGKVKMQDFHFVKKVDVASPKLYLASSSGKHFANVTVEVMKSSGGTKQKFLTVKLTEVYITGVSSARLGGNVRIPPTTPPLHAGIAAKPVSPPPPPLTESFSLSYSTIHYIYS